MTFSAVAKCHADATYRATAPPREYNPHVTRASIIQFRFIDTDINVGNMTISVSHNFAIAVRCML